MELSDLSLDQRKAVAVYAFQMMVADHTAVQAENRHVDWLERELDVLGTIAAHDYFTEPDAALFTDLPSRRLLLCQLMLVALADNHEHPDENALMRRLVEQFGWPAGCLRIFREWAETPPQSRPVISTLLA